MDGLIQFAGEVRNSHSTCSNLVNKYGDVEGNSNHQEPFEVVQTDDFAYKERKQTQ